ncbi:MAG: YbaN family protein [Zoogloea sp.]|uniref:YbaN family protein n=1 Tax=Zoogloea sp. TaxID=49181 RepID=UPI002625D6E7|nr:YbaN family protein [Zoogloea sp.]MDD3328924.1 YbaN family protein [Zoogloea sp.]
MRPSPCHAATAAIAPPRPGMLARAGRHGLFLLGGLSFAVGAAGLLVPLLPTTIFWIIAAWAWSKSCPRLQQRLYALPGAGPHVQSWIEDGTISRRGKLFAVSGLLSGLAMTALALHDQPLILTAAGLPQLAAALFVASRREGHG